MSCDDYKVMGQLECDCKYLEDENTPFDEENGSKI